MRIQFTLIALLGLALANPVLAGEQHGVGHDAHNHATVSAGEQAAFESWTWTEPESVVASAQPHQSGIRDGGRDQARHATESWTWTDPQD